MYTVLLTWNKNSQDRDERRLSLKSKLWIFTKYKQKWEYSLRLGDPSINDKTVYKCFINKFLQQFLIGSGPVSYTHLDVYKRQVGDEVFVTTRVGCLHLYKLTKNNMYDNALHVPDFR